MWRCEILDTLVLFGWAVWLDVPWSASRRRNIELNTGTLQQIVLFLRPSYYHTSSLGF
jgi:hypothetical protein